MGVVGVGVVRGTLLGPEGSGPLFFVDTHVVGVCEGECVGFLGCAGAVVCFARCGGVGGGCPGCWLRTVQWTRASLIFCGQVFKSKRWMPWHQEPKKDVVACDKPRGVGKRAVIRGFPNGETPHESCRVTCT